MNLIGGAGRHRLEAHPQLKLREIEAIVENGDSQAAERWRALAEIDDNLIRRDLTAAQRAKLVAQRKVAYEAVHPQTKHGATGRGRGKSGQFGNSIERFTADTAAKTGKPERTVQRDATRAKALGSDLDRVTGTSLDKGAELDALAAMPAEQRSWRNGDPSLILETLPVSQVSRVCRGRSVGRCSED